MGLFEIDTKGTCLLCLNPDTTLVTISDCDNSKLTQSAIAFKMLLRYLNVDIMKMSHFSSSVKPIPSVVNGGNNLSVSLCGDCSSISKDFYDLFQTLEGVRLQLNVCFSQLLEFMEKGTKDLARTGEFERRIHVQAQRSVKDLINVSMAESLRKETMEKVSRKLKFGVPRISLRRLNSKAGVDGVVAKDIKLGNCVPLLQSGEQELHVPGNLIKGGPERGGVTMNASIVPENKKIKASTSWNEMREPKVETLESTAYYTKILEEDDATVLGVKAPENNNKPSAQPPQVRLKKDAEAVTRSTSISGNKLSQRRTYCKCEICGKYFLQPNLLTHQLQRHTMEVLKDHLPSLISKEILESSLNVIVARSKVVAGYSKYNRRVVRECYFCKRREGYSLKVHLLKCHLEQVVSEHSEGNIVDSTQSQSVLPVPRKTTPQVVERYQTLNKPTTSSLNYSCNSCDKAFANLPALKSHFKKTHLASSQSQSRFKCSDCEKCFTRRNNLYNHRVYAHPLLVFSNRIPSDLADQDFQKGLDDIIGKSKEVAHKNTLDCELECPLCGKHVKKVIRMKVHITCRHLDKIVENAERIKQDVAGTNNYLFNPGPKLECVITDGENDNGYACEFEPETDPLAM